MSSFEQVKLTTGTGSIINPATEESIILLRRIARLLEPSGVQTAQGIQHVNVANTVTVLPASYPLSSGVNYPVVGSPAITTTTYWQPTWAGPIDPRWTNIEQARISYNTGIRSNLSFS